MYTHTHTQTQIQPLSYSTLNILGPLPTLASIFKVRQGLLQTVLNQLIAEDDLGPLFLAPPPQVQAGTLPTDVFPQPNSFYSSFVTFPFHVWNHIQSFAPARQKFWGRGDQWADLGQLGHHLFSVFTQLGLENKIFQK